MPLQDLTPQLRTRLSRLESVVGWFVLLAGALLLAGFVYYVWHTAQRKGWFQEKVLFSTFVNTAAGLKPGDPVRLMGFPIGEVTRVVPNDPNFQYGNITIFFVVRRDANHYCGYLWSDSRAKVVPTDFLGNRGLEITKGQIGIPLLRLANPTDPRSPITGRLDVQAVKKYTAKVVSCLGATNAPDEETKEIAAYIQKVTASPWEYSAKGFVESPEEMAALVVQAVHREHPSRFYVPYDEDKDIFIEPEESPALTERLERIITQAERALPSFLTLTNQLAQALDNAVRATAELESLLTNARPAVTHAGELTAELQQAVRDLRPMFTNLARISETLAQPQGSLGEWLLPTNVHRELLTVLRSASATLDTANTAIGNTETNLDVLVDHITLTLDNLALMTSNLNRQVEANTNILSDISDLIRNTDQFIQGLRRHWLLRSAFRTNRPPQRSTAPPPAALPPRLKP